MHPLDRQELLRCGHPVGGPDQPVHVDQVGMYLAMVSGSPLEVPAVEQHLHGDISGLPIQRLGWQVLVGEEHSESGRRLEVFNQTIAVGVGFQVPP